MGLPCIEIIERIASYRDWREYEVEEDLGEFPVGWEQRMTPSGVPYYVDHIHRTTTVTNINSAFICISITSFRF